MSELLTPKYVDISRPHGDFRIPIRQAVPDGSFPDDPEDWVFFGSGVGETGKPLDRIITEMSEKLDRRIIGYEPRLAAQSKDPWEDMVDVAGTTHNTVVDSLTTDKYNLIGHSLFGLTAGAILKDRQPQIKNLTLISPATITSESTVSEEWRQAMRTMDLADRAEKAQSGERGWRRNRTKLMLGFLAVNMAVETTKGMATNPIRSMCAGWEIAKDMWVSPNKLAAAFGVAANVSTIPELESAQANGTNVQIISGDKDLVFSSEDMKRAVLGTNLEQNLHIIDKGGGRGHSHMSMRSGEPQIGKAANITKLG